MIGIEADYCNKMITALVEANIALLDTTIIEAEEKSYVPHKGDTLGIDQIPENTIVAELKYHDQYAVIVTEERGEDVNPLAITSPESDRGPRTFFVCDPTDRSKQLSEFLRNFRGKKEAKVVDAIKKSNTQTRWEKEYGSPASITGANTAITCVRRGIPICSVIFNYITNELTVACSAGIYQSTLSFNDNLATADIINLDYLRSRGQSLCFPPTTREHWQRFVTFVGKPERGYPQNFRDSQLVPQNKIRINNHYEQPGGPTRILYLSSLQPRSTPIGFIVANGEKIGEWIHWLPFIRFAHQHDDQGEKALRLFEVSGDQSLMRDGYLLAPSPIYSIFRVVENIHNKTVIDVNRLQQYPNPSKYRATLLITPADNTWAMGRVEQHGYREITFFGD